MKEKPEVSCVFKTFKAFVEKQLGKIIKTLRSDKAGEFNSKEFDRFCESDGIHHQFTVGFALEQNGVS